MSRANRIALEKYLQEKQKPMRLRSHCMQHLTTALDSITFHPGYEASHKISRTYLKMFFGKVMNSFVIPAKAGIQVFQLFMDAGFRRHDEK